MARDTDGRKLTVRALTVVMAFGPDRRRPETERLREAVPTASSKEIADALREAHAIEERAYQLTAPCWPTEPLPDGEVKRLMQDAEAALAAEFPFLPADTISRLSNQAHYFHAK